MLGRVESSVEECNRNSYRGHEAESDLGHLLCLATFPLQEAAADNSLSNRRCKLLNIALSGAGLGHLLILAPLLGTPNSGVLTPVLVGTWGVAAAVGVVNTLQKPKY
jgi:hypothetical protein